MYSYGSLHTHDTGSCLGTGADGADIPLRKALFAKKCGMQFLGVTNHGNIYTWLAHVKACQQTDIQPILGIEAYHMLCFAKKPLKDDKKTMSEVEIAQAIYLGEDYHLTLIAQNNQGIENIYRMLTIASQDYFYGHIIFTNDLLEQHADGVICFSGCVGGYIAQHIICDKLVEAYAQMQFLHKIFKDNFYLEVMPNDFPDQIKVNTQLQIWSDLYNIPIVATDDSHYLPGFYESYKVLRAIRNYPESNVDYSSLFLHDEEQMVDGLSNTMGWEREWSRQYVEESGRIAKKCSYTFDYPIDMPELSGIEDAGAELRKRCLRGIIAKHKFYVDDDGKRKILPEYNNRLAYELDLIMKKGYTSYMLISASLPAHALENGYEVQGRGSVCNSLVAWLLGIHRIDPIRYGLDFHRFISPNRTTNPDIDNDCPDNKRDELIAWMQQEYGQAVPISTFGTYKTQSVLNQLVRVLSMESGDAQRFRDAVNDYNPNDVQPKYKEMMQGEADYNNELRRLERKYKAVTHYCWLWGQMSTIGTHAAGVVMSHDDILQKLAIVRSHDDDKKITYATCYDNSMGYLEEMLGLLKMDVLGLNTLTMVLEAETYAGVKYTDVILTDEERDDRKNHMPFLYDDVDLDSSEVMQVFCDADTLGLMQMETTTPMKYCKQLQPESIADVALISACNRPMAKGVFAHVLAWKKGKEPYPLVYQEDIMERCVLAGLEWSRIDMLLKTLKRNQSLDKETKGEFVQGMVENTQCTTQVAQEMWDGITGYGFLKGHATAYAHLAARQAWLKKYRPFSFFLSLLRNAKKDDRKSYEADAARHGIRLMIPSVNGGANYTEIVIPEHLDKDGNTVAEKHFIQQGMCVVDGVGDTRAQAIEAERIANGEYTSREDIEGAIDEKTKKLIAPGRVPRMIVNSAVMSALDNCGALCFDGARYMRRSNQYTMSRAQVPQTPLGADDDKWKAKYRNGNGGNGKYKR